MVGRRTVILGAIAAAAAGTALYRADQHATYRELADSIRVPKSGLGEDAFAYLLHFATLAANSHNTQAWLFTSANNEITIRPDYSRATPVADPDNHHLFASLGCACENLSLAAEAAGTTADAAFVGADGGSIKIGLTPGSRSGSPLFDAIPARQCTRSLYDGQPVANGDLQTLEAAADIDGCHVILIQDKAKIEQVLELVTAANRVQVGDPAFVRELKSWLRFSAADAMDRRDGLYSACSGNPSLPSWLGSRLFDMAFTPDAQSESYAAQIRSSSGLAVFVSDRDDKAHWIQAGRSYQRFALQATALGLKHAFINQPLEVAPFRPELARLLGIESYRPDLLLRYGSAPALPKSLRRPLTDVMR